MKLSTHKQLYFVAGMIAVALMAVLSLQDRISDKANVTETSVEGTDLERIQKLTADTAQQSQLIEAYLSGNSQIDQSHVTTKVVTELTPAELLELLNKSSQLNSMAKAQLYNQALSHSDERVRETAERYARHLLKSTASTVDLMAMASQRYLVSSLDKKLFESSFCRILQNHNDSGLNTQTTSLMRMAQIKSALWNYAQIDPKCT